MKRGDFMEQEYTVKVKDMVGKKFNRLRVLEPVKHRGTRTRVYWKCECNCGEVVEIRQDRLLKGTTKSCGCLQTELWGKRAFVRKDEEEALKQKNEEEALRTDPSRALPAASIGDKEESPKKKKRRKAPRRKK